MPVEVATGAEPTPRRARYLVPMGFPRRGELLAAFLVAAVLTHVLFAQLTLVLAVAFHLTGKVTRWRRSWLAGPALSGVAWTAIVGPRAALDGFTAGPAAVIGYLGASGHQASHLLHITAAFTGMASWLPRQLPLAIVAAAAEAAVAGWVSWLHTDEWDLPPPRPGLIVAARRAAVTRSIRAGGVAARDGGCLGVVPESGGRITLPWSAAAGGVCVCGSDERDVMMTSFQLVHAAVRRRKPVLAVDLTCDPGLPRQLAAVCAAAGAPLRIFREAAAKADAEPEPQPAPACYEPFRYGDPARRASLVAAMLSWDGPGHRYRRSCVAYLEDIFELIDAAPGDPRVPVLDEVIHLLNPAAMRARMEYVPADHPRREVLAERIRVSVSLIGAEPASTAQLTTALRELRASALGRWLRPPGYGRPAQIDLGQALSERGVVLFRLGGSEQAAGASAMLGRLVCQDLLTTAPCGLGSAGIIWLTDCGLLPRHYVADMISRGQDAGLAVLAGSTSPLVAADLADLVNAVVALPGGDQELLGRLDEVTGEPGALSALGDGEFLLAVRNPRWLVPRARRVLARVPQYPRGAAGATRRVAGEGA
jgi:hypothetical protein